MPAKSLQELVDLARTHSPFYAEAYRDVPRTVSHITQLPLVDQDAFWAATRGNRLLTGPLTDAGVYKSGGTTGAPKLSPWTRTEHAEALTAFGAGMVQAGLKPGHRVANLFRAGELYSGFLFIEGALHHAPVDNVRLPVGGSAPNDYIADLVNGFGVHVLAGEPMKLSAVAEHLVQRGESAGSVELLLFG
ncbi:phenylacetate--CoA ligase family protein, partial [Kitasatospora sp. NPDC007106]